jgi:ketosteroid isomerase-like protein
MKRFLIAALIFATICVPAFAQKNGDDINALVKGYYAAWNTLNLDNPAKFYAKDADLVFFDIAPLKYAGGWTEYSENFKKNVAPAFVSLTLTPGNDIKVTRKGNIALATLTFHFAAKQKDGQVLDFDGRHTLVFEKRGAQWLIIHEHVSKPLF